MPNVNPLATMPQTIAKKIIGAGGRIRPLLTKPTISRAANIDDLRRDMAMGSASIAPHPEHHRGSRRSLSSIASRSQRGQLIVVRWQVGHSVIMGLKL